MRHLKQTLSYLLIAACLIGTFTLPGVAAKSTPAVLRDLNEVLNQEAVILMSELGIISGKDNGIFAPREGIDRASMAKLIYGILAPGVDEKIFLHVETGLKDTRGHWAESYINYCYSTKIIVGKGHGLFAPNDSVSVAAAAKMLLVTLGFDSGWQGYENSPEWSSNIMRDARDVGLLEGIAQYDFEMLSRDNAARMIYNALFCQIRLPRYNEIGGEKKVVGYAVQGTTLGQSSLGLVKCVMHVADVTTTMGDPSIYFVETVPEVNTISGGAVILDPLRSGQEGFQLGPEYAGHNVVLYAKAKYSETDEGQTKSLSFEELYLNKIFFQTVKPIAKSTDGTAITGQDSLTDSVGKRFMADLEGKEVAYLVNGVAVSEMKANEAATQRGTVVELVDTNRNGQVDTVRITVKYGGVLSGDVAFRKYNGIDQAQLPGISFLSDWVDLYLISGAEKWKQGDGVLVAKIGNTIYLEKADVILGHGVDQGKIGDMTALKIDGKLYIGSGLKNGTIDGWVGQEGYYIFYLDDNGDVFAAAPANLF